MRQNILLSTLGIFALAILTLSLASAVSLSPIDNATVTIPTDVVENAGSFDITFDLTNTGVAGTLNWSDSVITSGTATITFDKSSIAVGTETVTATVTFGAGQTGSIAGTIDVIGQSASTHRTLDFSVPIAASPDFEFCSDGEIGASFIDIQSIKDQTKDNADEWEWRRLDNIELDIKIKNTGDDDEDYTVELIFVDEDNNIVDVAEDEDDLEQDVSVDEDERETVTFEFQIDGEAEEGDYTLHVKVYREGDEDELCTSEEAEDEVEIEVKKHDVIVKSVTIPDTIKAGTTIDVEARVSNIGSEDQEKVRVKLISAELGIKIEEDVDDLDEGDEETVTFLLTIPEDAEEKKYTLTFAVDFDYDDNDEEFDKSTDSADLYKEIISVLANGESTTSDAEISAILASEAKEGQEMLVQVSIKNNGNTADFIVAVEGYESWANLVGVEPSILNIAKGETKQVLVKLNPTESGTQSFIIKTVYSGKTAEQPVSVSVTETTGAFTGAFAGAGSALYILGIGIVVLLILIIIVLAVKVSRAATSEF